MGNMGYCRHENVAGDLRDVIENWEYVPNNEHEIKARKRILEMIVTAYASLEDNGLVDEVGELTEDAHLQSIYLD